MSEADMMSMRAVMRAIFGTDAQCREVERRESEELLARVEHKVGQLDRALNKGRARSLNEAVDQVSGSER